MAEEEIKNPGIEAAETSDETPVEPTPTAEGGESEPTTDAKETPVESEEKPCDPATMTCDEMRDEIIDLSEERAKYNDSIKKLEDVKGILPSDEINKIHDTAVEKKKEVDDRIYNLFEKFSVCTTKSVEEEKPEQNE